MPWPSTPLPAPSILHGTVPSSPPKGVRIVGHRVALLACSNAHARLNPARTRADAQSMDLGRLIAPNKVSLSLCLSSHRQRHVAICQPHVAICCIPTPPCVHAPLYMVSGCAYRHAARERGAQGESEGGAGICHTDSTAHDTSDHRAASRLALPRGTLVSHARTHIHGQRCVCAHAQRHACCVPWRGAAQMPRRETCSQQMPHR